MKKIVVIYKGNDWYRDVPFKNLATRAAFEDWHTRSQKHGFEMYRSSIDWYDTEKNVFSKAWAYRDGTWLKISKPIKPSLIFDKLRSSHNYNLFDLKMAINKNVKIFNNPLFRSITDNKLGQYMLFARFMPNSYLANSKREYLGALAKIKTKMVVVKPLYGSGGFGIFIGPKSDAIRKQRLKYPLLVQEFITGAGIPNFTPKGHLADLRIIYFDHKIIYSLSRIARKGSLFTNFHQGAEAVLVPRNKIPRSALAMSKEIVAQLAVFPEANYSLDFIFDKKGKPYLVEMNTTPGFDLLNIVGGDALIEKNLRAFLGMVE